MKKKLTVLLPAIRTQKWVNIYNSIRDSFSLSWELIIITSKELPDKLKNKDNIKVIYSRRSPLQKQQEGLCQAEGDWITWMSDDSLWVARTLDIVFNAVNKKGFKTFAVLKYLEGEEFEFPEWYLREHPEFKTNYEFMRSDMYYYSKTHDSTNYKYIPDNTPMLSNAIVSKEAMYDIGGWDCQFQTVPMANCDLAVRLLKHGCDYIIHDEIAQICTHLPGTLGDHGPIHYAQIEDDEPLLKKIYTSADLVEVRSKTKLDLYNWKNTPEVWARGKEQN